MKQEQNPQIFDYLFRRTLVVASAAVLVIFVDSLNLGLPAGIYPTTAILGLALGRLAFVRRC